MIRQAEKVSTAGECELCGAPSGTHRFCRRHKSAGWREKQLNRLMAKFGWAEDMRPRRTCAKCGESKLIIECDTKGVCIDCICRDQPELRSFYCCPTRYPDGDQRVKDDELHILIHGKPKPQRRRRCRQYIKGIDGKPGGKCDTPMPDYYTEIGPDGKPRCLDCHIAKLPPSDGCKWTPERAAAVDAEIDRLSAAGIGMDLIRAKVLTEFSGLPREQQAEIEDVSVRTLQLRVLAFDAKLADLGLTFHHDITRPREISFDPAWFKSLRRRRNGTYTTKARDGKRRKHNGGNPDRDDRRERTPAYSVFPKKQSISPTKTHLIAQSSVVSVGVSHSAPLFCSHPNDSHHPTQQEATR